MPTFKPRLKCAAPCEECGSTDITVLSHDPSVDKMMGEPGFRQCECNDCDNYWWEKFEEVKK